jgi:hypothetical protein
MTTTTYTATAAPSARTHAATPAFHRLLWLFPLAFVFHIVEESAGFVRWVEDTLHGTFSLREFLINNAIFMAVLVGLVTLATRGRARWTMILLFVWVSGQQLWNFVFHVYTEIVFAAYSPGLVTAILFYYPLYLFLAYRAVQTDHLRRSDVAMALGIGAAGFVLTIWGGLYHFGPMPETWIPAALR